MIKMVEMNHHDLCQILSSHTKNLLCFLVKIGNYPPGCSEEKDDKKQKKIFEVSF